MKFEEFLSAFVSKVQEKSKQVNQAAWILETTGTSDAAALKASLEIELRLMFSDKKIFDQLVAWDQDPNLTDPVLKRQLDVLMRSFKPCLIPQELLKQMAEQEAHLSLLYSSFRAEVDGKSFSENEIRQCLKNEGDVALRKRVWEASKQVGKILAPSILKLVELRNQAAKSLGYKNYFSMQLQLQEVDEEALFALLETVATQSDLAYVQMKEEIDVDLARRFGVAKEELGPWSWSEPFCQEDPLGAGELDALCSEVDMLQAATQFYQKMGMNVVEVLQKSDHFERAGKSQHAFCMHIDREGDVRTLNNICPSIKWLETVLHELGHAVYELGYDPSLPWLLKEPPHMITTEAMALLAGRQAYRVDALDVLAPKAPRELKQKAEMSLRRRQLIFSRWVLVMTYFERELYRDPQQDLNGLWWDLVERFQKVKKAPSSHLCDWAAKYHIGLAPVYYFSYLLGELFASSIEKRFPIFASKQTGEFLNEHLFKPGNRMSWSDLIEQVTGARLTADAWLCQFAIPLQKQSSDLPETCGAE